MRQLLASLVISISNYYCFLPQTALAIETDEPELGSFLEDISWEAKDYIDYLESFSVMIFQ